MLITDKLLNTAHGRHWNVLTSLNKSCTLPFQNKKETCVDPQWHEQSLLVGRSQQKSKASLLEPRHTIKYINSILQRNTFKVSSLKCLKLTANVFISTLNGLILIAVDIQGKVVTTLQVRRRSDIVTGLHSPIQIWILCEVVNASQI